MDNFMRPTVFALVLSLLLNSTANFGMVGYYPWSSMASNSQFLTAATSGRR